MKKDVIISSLSSIIGIGIIAYSIYIYTQKLDIIPSQVRTFDIAILVVCILLGFFFLAFGLLRMCFLKHRVKQVLFGILIILFSYYTGMSDNPDTHIYLKDILCIIGMIVTILGFTKICIYSKCDKKIKEKQIESGEIEIIEV